MLDSQSVCSIRRFGSPDSSLEFRIKENDSVASSRFSENLLDRPANSSSRDKKVSFLCIDSSAPDSLQVLTVFLRAVNCAAGSSFDMVPRICLYFVYSRSSDSRRANRLVTGERYWL